MHDARRVVEVGLLANGLLALSCTSLTNNATAFYIMQVKENMLIYPGSLHASFALTK